MVILSEVGDVGKGGGASPTLGGACWQRGALGGAGAISGAGDGECEDERPGGDFAGVDYSGERGGADWVGVVCHKRFEDLSAGDWIWGGVPGVEFDAQWDERLDEGQVRRLVLCILMLLPARAMAAVEVSLPLGGYWRPGEDMPVRVGGGEAGSSIESGGEGVVAGRLGLRDGRFEGVVRL